MNSDSGWSRDEPFTASWPMRHTSSRSRDSDWSRDEPIAGAIEREIQARMQPNAPPINVAAQGATVTLTGHVANQATKDALVKLARDTGGVIDVTDNLVIGGGHPFLDWLFPWRDGNRNLEEADKGVWYACGPAERAHSSRCGGARR